ncbi:TIM barrel protein [Akkermansia sp.]|uniref:sugar phosphate isomerase/epimerase family protein n=1 Tax=Akkermansia sp. TaxID=1872421 RepID=UPI0025BA5501|nr:TIM barrel protein [Akkermansia sp.]MCC8147912.1 sugar phosphate isomerase/epimerase [Akkermansia sp.]
MIDEILSLGFDHVELSHGIKLSLLPGIMKAVEAGKVQVAGVHNYFPAPIDEVGDAPDSRPFTADLPQVRDKAVELTKKSMEQGAALGAGYIVLHMGTVEPLVKRTDTAHLQSLARQGRVGTESFAGTKGEFVRRRNRLAPVYLERAREAIRQLLPRAAELGVKLGIEGRSHYEQVPSEDEMALLMQEFGANPFIGYWHDFGHIQRKHNLLILNHEQFLRRMSSHLVGGHVNDVKWPSRDHQVPLLAGGVPFERLLPLFPPGVPLVWELSGRASAEDIRAARELWIEKFPQTLD